MKDVFEIVHADSEKVILKVNAKDALTVAMNPFVSSDYEYITVTRGSNHILTVVKVDGRTFDFHWGEEGYTLISDSLEILRSRVVDFIENKNFIPLEWTGKEFTDAVLYYNNYLDRWQLRFSGVNEKGNKLKAGNYFMPHETDFDSAMEIAKKITHVQAWRCEENPAVGNPGRTFRKWTAII